VFLLTVSGGSDSTQNKKRRLLPAASRSARCAHQAAPFLPAEKRLQQHLLPGKKGERSCFFVLLCRS